MEKLITFWNTKVKEQAKDAPKAEETPQPKIEEEVLEETEHMRKRKRPQDDIPMEVILHYIVKDYRRMFNKYEHLSPKIKAQREKINKLVHLLRQKQVEQMTDEKAKEVMTGLMKRVSKYDEMVANLTKERDELKEKCDKLIAQIDDVRSSRNAVVEAVTDDLQQKLDEANQRIKLLAQAVVEPEKADSIFLQQCAVHTIETDDDRKWMAGATKQLEKSAMQLLSVSDRLTKMEEALKGVNGIDIDKALKNHGKALSKLTAVISHIECFFDKVGDIQVIDDEEDN